MTVTVVHDHPGPTVLQHGDLFANIEDRTIRGLLIPYGEASRTNLSGTEPVMFSRGTVSIPRDVTMVGLNDQHDRFRWVGRVQQLDDTDEGMVATFAVADTDEGDEALAAVQSGRLSKLSAEIVDLVRDGVNAVRAKLTGAALVTAGAFESAALFALATPDEDTPDDAPAPPEPDADESAEEEEEAVPNATVPTGLPAPAPAEVVVQEKTRGEMFAAIEAVYRGSASRDTVQDVRDFFAGQALFALTDIKYDGAGGLAPTMNPNPQWIGEVGGKPYIQRFVPLFGSKTLTGLNLGGFTWTGDAGGTWTGNKTAIPSTAPTVAPVSDTATRWANGNDIAREHQDFNTPGFFESYNAWNRRGFDKWLDLTITLPEAVAGATDITADSPTGLDIGAALSAVIDGAAAIVDAGLTPTAAVMDTALWKTIAKVPQADVLGYLNAQLSLTGDSGIDSFSIVPAPVGTITAGHVLVVARDAADVYTLPGSPIRAEAQNIANGGIDVGFFGYGALFINDPAGIVDVAPAVAARASSK